MNPQKTECPLYLSYDECDFIMQNYYVKKLGAIYTVHIKIKRKN
jgi:hypothetical protein